MPGTGSTRKRKPWEEEKERLMSLSQDEKRKELAKGYVPLEDIPTLLQEYRKTSADVDNQDKNNLFNKISLYKGDITQLEVDAIVNAANSSLLGGGGVDGCIHRAAGPNLIAECRTLGGCPTGEAKITCGYQLPAKYVIHTVGPIARGHLSDIHKEDLKSCYKSSLALAKDNNIRSIAFPCISTGIYGFPNEPAASIALNTAKEWLSENQDWIDRIIFCVFLEIDFKIYKMKLKEYFPKAIVTGDMKEPEQEESEDVLGDTRDPGGEESDAPDELKGPGGDESDQDDITGPGQDPEPAQSPQTQTLTPEDQSSPVKEEKNQKDTEAQEEMITESQSQSQIMESEDTVTSNSPEPVCESEEQNRVTSELSGYEIATTDVEMNSQSTEIPPDSNQLGEIDEEKDNK